ncbi:exopolysaccharide polymerization protein [Megasphaera elsdenii CAG:570]|uniref:Exopolysaccharide polymerization protein n=1 Tax=Megasphaera elsdenii CAG:570 TaxID=1263087 RepID=R7N2I0_MEGEL|nr:EpsG family protein [Megasphaera elsdenii]ALG41882.1 hypothetical protein AZ49_04595 [Megasphaera elsdenii 14-14]CDF06267.1 exopolysaccharide polymerization protein [Megasphaera elsdenii CAG:570]
MLIYIFLLIWVLLCSLVPSVKLNYGAQSIFSGKLFYLIITFLPIWFIAAFRSLSVGTDTTANALYFVSAASGQSFADVIMNGGSSAGFNVISYLVGFLSSDFEMYTFWSSTIIAIGFAAFIYRTSKQVWLSTFLFLALNMYFISFNASRQFISISIALNAFVYLCDHTYSKKGWGLFILAGLIHNSIFSFLPAVLGIWLVRRCKTYRKLYFWSCLLSLLVVISLAELTNIFAAFFPHYAIYTEGTSSDNLIENTGGGRIIVEYLAFLLIVVTYYIGQWLRKQKVGHTLYDACLPGAIFCIISGIAFNSNTMMNRVALPYACLYISLIPYVFAQFRYNIRYILNAITIIGLSAFYYLWAQGNLGDVIPYSSWLWN